MGILRRLYVLALLVAALGKSFPTMANQLQDSSVASTSSVPSLRPVTALVGCDPNQDYESDRYAHFTAIAGRLPELGAILARLKGAVDAATKKTADLPKPVVQRCQDSITMADRRVKSALTAKSAEKYGLVSDLVSDEEDESESRLQKAVASCSSLQAQLHDPDSETRIQELSAITNKLLADFKAINRKQAKAKAEVEMRYAKNTLQTILYDMNLFSVSPTFVFDVARLGPKSDDLGGVRYGIGGGITFGLVSHVTFTAGYAWNPDRHAGEPPGTFFFSLRTRNLFE